MQTNTDQMAPLLLRPGEAAAVLGMSRSTIYELMASGEIPSIKVAGRSRRIATKDLVDYVDALRREQGIQ